MNGVEILAEMPANDNVLRIIFSCISLVFIVVLTIIYSAQKSPGYTLMGIIGVILLTFAIAVYVCTLRNEQYIAVVDDSASYTQLNDKYIVHEHYGKVYYLEERNKNANKNDE